jgi:hypothetical protein
MKDHNDLINNQDLAKQRNGVFVFRYDPTSSFEGMFEEF